MKDFHLCATGSSRDSRHASKDARADSDRKFQRPASRSSSSSDSSSDSADDGDHHMLTDKDQRKKKHKQEKKVSVCCTTQWIYLWPHRKEAVSLVSFKEIIKTTVDYVVCLCRLCDYAGPSGPFPIPVNMAFVSTRPKIFLPQTDQLWSPSRN